MWCWYSWRWKCQTVSLVIRGSDDMRLALDVWEMKPRSSPVTRQMHENAWEAKWFINKEIEVWMKLTAMILTNVCLDLWYNSLLGHSIFHPHPQYGRHDSDSPLFSNSDSDTTSLCTNSDSNTPITYWNSHSKLILSWQFMLLYNTPILLLLQIERFQHLVSQITVSNTTPELKIPNSKREVSNITKLCLHREGGCEKTEYLYPDALCLSLSIIYVGQCSSL